MAEWTQRAKCMARPTGVHVCVCVRACMHACMHVDVQSCSSKGQGTGWILTRLGLLPACTCRWGATLIAYRKDRLLRRGGHEITDWADLLQPQLKGRVAVTGE